MKRILPSILCAVWLFLLFGPGALFYDSESRIILVVATDVALFGTLVWLFADWVKKRKGGLVLAALVAVLASHAVLPPLSDSVFFIVAILPIVVFFGVALFSIGAQRGMKNEPNQALQPTAPSGRG